MRQRKFLTVPFLIASGLVLAGSSCDRENDVRHLPPPPQRLATDQIGQPKPVLPESAATSEKAYEDWVSDRFDWGDRRDSVAWRWCNLYNTFAQTKTDCGPAPITDDDSS